jgi:hypothetical protein
MKQFRLLLITLLLTTPIPLFSQCSEGEIEITVSILTDNYPGEITWILTEESGTLLSGGPYSNQSTTYESSVCISDNGEPSCLQFVINDSYGDGICCGYGTGAYYLLIDGVEIASGGNYGSQDSIQFDCAPGMTCNDAVALSAVDYGAVAQATGNFWYTFTPEINGMYEFNSCGSGCNSTLFIYEYCNMNNFDNTNEGTIYFDDYEGGCGYEASQTVLLEGGVQYWIRWGSSDDSCSGLNCS